MAARVVPAETVHPLRTRILRPGWNDRLAIYPEDSLPTVSHLAVFQSDEVVGVGTVYPEAPPEQHRGVIPDNAYRPGTSYRLRGMATSPEVRGTGLGRAVLEGCFSEIRSGGGSYLWCNARLIAVPFYERMGLTAVGDLFEMPEIGPHYVMWCAV